MRGARLNFFITLLGFLDTHLLIPVIALYAVSLGGQAGTAGFIVGVYSITNTFANVLGGRLVDRYGFRRPLIAGLIGDTISMLAYAFCFFPWHIALVRAFHGFTGGLVGPSTMSSLASLSKAGEKGRAMGIYGAAIALATLIGYGGGGLIASKLGYNYVFFTGGFLLLIGIILAFYMPRSNLEKKPAVTRQEGWATVLKLLKSPALSIPYWTIFAQYFAFGAIVTLLPLYLSSLNLEAYHMGILLSAFSLVFIVVQFIGGRLSDARGRLLPALIGIVLAVIGVIALPLSGAFSLMLLCMLIFGIGFGFIFPSVCAIVVDETVASEYGAATGIFHALITIGVAVGAPLMGWLAHFLGIQVSLSMAALPLAAGIFIVVRRWITGNFAKSGDNSVKLV